MSTIDGLKEEVKSFSDNWSGHGVHRIAISNNIIKKFFYTAVFIACAVLFSIQIRKLFIKYSSYPVNTVVEILNDPLRFPAVTICNKNVVRKSKLALGGATLQGIVNRSEAAFSSGMDFNYDYSGSGSGSGEDELSGSGSGSGDYTGSWNNWDGDYTGYYGSSSGDYMNSIPDSENDLFDIGSEEDAFYDEENVTWLTSGKTTGKSATAHKISMALLKLNITSRREMGHQLKEMLQSCSINEETCFNKNFSMFYNVQYGNCFTFNGMKTARPIYTFKSGPMFGLDLQLVLEQDEYIGSLSRTAGMRLTVHDPFDFPFPEDSGIDLSPGKVTSVGLKLKVMEKLGQPYSTCTHERGMKIAYKGKYTVEACRKTCLQGTIVKNCNCADTRYSNANLYKARSCDNVTDYSCITKMVNKFHKTDDCECPPACRMKVYQQTVSSADFPSLASEPDLKETIMNRSTRLNEIFNTTETTIVSNLLQVQVFYESLQYEQIKEEPAYDFETLLSDVGGQAGLFIGWSVITFVEVVEFIGNLLWIICKRAMFRQPTTSNNIIKVAPVDSQ